MWNKIARIVKQLADTRLSNTIVNVRLVEPLGHDDLIKAEIV